MVIYGQIMTFWIQKELDSKINEAIKQFPDNFRSRSAFVNGAVHRELRRLGIVPKEVEKNW